MTDDDRLDVLLIEDNPGDARLIEEMLRDAEQLLDRVEVDGSTIEGSEVHHEQTLTDALELLEADGMDVVLLDLGLPESTGLETLTTVTDATEFVPIVVLTGLDDEGVGIKAIEHGAQDFLVKDEVTSELLARSVHYALERNRQERERARRREQLQALNRLNRIGHDVTHAVITTSTREELEAAVCERLVEDDGYQFAWIGEVDRLNDEIKSRVTAGEDDGYLDEITVTLNEGDTADGPAARAVETREVQAIGEIGAEGVDEQWQTAAAERGFRSAVSIPIHHEELLYGVLNVYATTPRAFSGAEREILARLGDVIGHAITAIERKEALVSDTVLELEFQVPGIAERLVGLTSGGEGTVDVENFIRTGDDLLTYGRASAIHREEFVDVLESDDSIEEFRILTSGTEEFEFEFTMPLVSSLATAVATHGGRLTSMTIADGRLRLVVEFPPGRDRRQLVALVEEHCPGADNVAQRTVERSTEEVADFRSVFHDRLTEKQRTALETAYFAGLFDWPRKSTGQEVAERLGVSPPTFTQHLRAAEQKFFDAVFEDPAEERLE